MPEQLSMLPPLGDEDLADLEGQVRAMQDYAKAKSNWENAFQRWSNKESQDGATHWGCCGHGQICDYCEDNSKGRPCVRALNTMCREKRLTIDYTNRNFEEWF